MNNASHAASLPTVIMDTWPHMDAEPVDAPRVTRYKHVAELGEGGMGRVSLVHDRGIDREVAMKSLKRVSPDVAARFLREVRIVGQLEHPNIVPIHDVGVDASGLPYFIMKKVDGETLDEIIGRLKAGDASTHAEWTFGRRLQVADDILSALEFAHERGIVHRDIKPENIFIDESGNALLMDWGIAFQVERAGVPKLELSGDFPLLSDSPEGDEDLRLTRAGEIIGTPMFMSPEQTRAEDIDERTDLYSLSAVLYEFLTLEHYMGEPQSLVEAIRRVQERVPKIAGLIRTPHQPPVPAELGHVLHRGLRKDREARYQNAAELRLAIQRARDGEFPIQCPVTFAKRSALRFNALLDSHPTAMLVAIGLTAMFSVSIVGWAIAQAMLAANVV